MDNISPPLSVSNHSLDKSPSNNSLHSASSLKKNNGPDIYNIGITAQKIHHRAYNIIVLPLSSDLHLIINHGNTLLIHNCKRKQIIKQKQLTFGINVIKASFSHRWRLIFLMDQFQNIHVYSDSLVKLSQGKDNVKELRHCVDFYYIDSSSAFVVITPQCIKILFVEIATNHIHSLFENAYKFSMKQLAIRILEPSYFLPFAFKIQMLPSGFLYIYNSTQIKIINCLQNSNFFIKSSQKNTQSFDSSGKPAIPILANKICKKTIISVQDICSIPQQLTQVSYVPENNLIIAGSNTGDLRVFKLNFQNLITTQITQQEMIKVAGKSVLAFKLSLHNQRPILSLTMYSPKIVLTVGQDDYLEVVSLEQMNVIQKFRTPPNIQQPKFLSHNLFISVRKLGFEKKLFNFDVCLDYDLVLQHNSTLVHSIFSQNMTVLALSDNSFSILLKKDRSKPPTIKQAFVPPRSKTILSMQKYPYLSQKDQICQQYWLLTDQCQIYKYRVNIVEQNVAIDVVAIEYVNKFMDIYNHQTHQKVIKMKFIDVVPVYFDSDIKQKSYERNNESVTKIKPIAFGCETGQVLICSCESVNSIISRIRYFPQPVRDLASCFIPNISAEGQQNKNQQGLAMRRRGLFFCNESEIVCVLISNYDIPRTVHKIKMNQQFFIKNLSPNFMAIVSSNTVKVMFPDPLNPIQLMMWISKTNIHQANISCLEYCGNNLSISGDHWGIIAIWTFFGQILIRFQASQPIITECCFFCSDVFTFGYNGKIFEIAKKFKFLNKKGMKSYCDQNIMQNKEWRDNFTINLKDQSNDFDKMMKIVRGALKIKGNKQKSQKLTNQKEIDTYVQKMKKSLIKLNVKNESNPLNAHHQTLDQAKSARKDHSHRLARQEKKHGFSSGLGEKSRAKSNFIKKPNISTSRLKHTQDYQGISLPKITPFSAAEEHPIERKNRNRNKKYQFLFHFPNVGLYSQLISKNMLQ